MPVDESVYLKSLQYMYLVDFGQKYKIFFDFFHKKTNSALFQIFSYVNNNLGEGEDHHPDSSRVIYRSGGGAGGGGVIDKNTIIMSPPLANAEAKPSNTVMEPPRRIAISVQGAWKQYGSGKGLKVTPVLQGLNMTVREGTM